MHTAIGAGHQCPVAQQVDDPRDTAAQGMQPLDRGALEHHRHRFAGDCQAMADVLLHILPIERLQHRLQGDALIELTQIGRSQDVEQPWLADEDNLQQPGIAVHPRDDAQFLEHLGLEMLRFVDDDDRAAAQWCQGDQEFGQGGDELVFGRVGKALAQQALA